LIRERSGGRKLLDNFARGFRFSLGMTLEKDGTVSVVV
jgi:hypothetical protein